MEIAEYIYVDRQRLASYFQQISSPVRYDKVPVWKFALGLGGPSAEGTQQRPGRPYTEHEQIVELFKELPLARDSDGARPFAVLSCLARRVVIPGVERAGLPGVALWTCRKAQGAQVDGYLIEAPRCDEDEPLRRYSGVTAIALLAEELSRSGHSQSASTLEQSLETTSSEAGHRPGPEYKIDSLVRLRVQSVWGFIAYPIFIAKHPSPFWDPQSRDSLAWDMSDRD